MVAFLIAMTSYQFLFRSLHLDGSTLYLLLSPYVVLAPFIVIWIGSLIVEAKPVDRNLAIGLTLLFVFPCIMLRTYSNGPEFVFLFIRGMQFFWGPLIIVPALLGLFRAVRFVDYTGESVRKYVLYLALLTGGLTIMELIAVKVLGLSPLIFPWIYGEGRNDIDPFRPWGLPSFSQVNAVVLALLFWLSYLYRLKGVVHKWMTYLGTLLSFNGTGQIGLLALTPLIFRHPFRSAVIGLAPFLAVVAYATSQELYYASGQNLLARFDIAYVERLSYIFVTFGLRFFSQFTLSDFLFGTAVPTTAAVVGITHDWAYLDVFYVYGACGVLGYIALYSGLLYNCCPLEASRSKRLFFVVIALLLNFHYGALNYFVGQMMVCCLAALQLNHIYARQVSRRHALQVA